MNKFFSKVYGWLFIGLLITFFSGYYVSTNQILMHKLLYSPLVYIIFIAEILIAIILSTRITKMNPLTVEILYLGYTLLTGITFASLFQMFKIPSIIYIFLVTSIVFAIFAIIGYYTKVDLTRISTLLFVGLIAIIILEIINIFLLNSTLDMLACIISLIIFFAYVAYDMQRIKTYALSDSLAIYGAFELYLDFVNIFIDLLQIFGDRDN